MRIRITHLMGRWLSDPSKELPLVCRLHGPRTVDSFNDDRTANEL
jgi:hypothetical protein